MSRGADMADTAASSGSGQEPQPQRGAGPPDLVTFNIGAKQFEIEFSQKVQKCLVDFGDEFKTKESRSPGYFILYDLLYS